MRHHEKRKRHEEREERMEKGDSTRELREHEKDVKEHREVRSKNECSLDEYCRPFGKRKYVY